MLIKMRRVVVGSLALFMLASLCACSAGEDKKTTTKAEVVTTEGASAEQTEVPVQNGDAYNVKVFDVDGNPIAGALVQMCLETCFPSATNEEGIAVFPLEEGDYKVTFLRLPDGYAYSDERTEFYFETGSKEMTITLKKAE